MGRVLPHRLGRLVLLLVLAAAAVGVWWWRRGARQPDPALAAAPEWPPLAAAAPTPAPVNGSAVASAAAWIEPSNGTCPDGYPVKAARSGVYHVPGGSFYDRTTPDRCYATAAAAEADGYRASKR
jgi:hypothetical protein